jgi:hypothetical protein
MIKSGAQLTIARIPLSQLQVLELTEWTCFPEKFALYLKLLQDNPHLDVDPLIVQPNPDFPGMYAIINGKHRFTASIVAGRKDALCVVEESAIRYDIPVWLPTTLDKYEIKELLEKALSIDGAHHKQWYLWRIAEALGLELPNDLVDKGIAP